jgi:hypothetical protein
VVVSELEALLTEIAPRGFVGWAAAHSLLARCQNRMGHHAQAKRGTAQALSLVSEQDRELVALFLGLEIEHALACSGLGEHVAAAAQLDALLLRHTAGQNPLTLGRLHEARALVALATDDRTAFSAHAQMAQRCFGATEIEVLVARGQALTSHANRVSLQPLATGPSRQAPAPVTVVSSVGCDAQRLVEQLQRATRTADCALFRLEAHQPQLLAFSGEQPANSLLDALRRRIEQTATWVAEQDGETTTSTAAAQACQASPGAEDGLSIFVLTTRHDAETRIVGAVVLDLRMPHSIHPTASLLRDIAQQILPTTPQQASSGE